jgi:hypothetical protein
MTPKVPENAWVPGVPWVGAGAACFGAGQPQQGITAAPSSPGPMHYLDADFDGVATAGDTAGCLKGRRRVRHSPGPGGPRLWWQIQLILTARLIRRSRPRSGGHREAERVTVAEPNRARLVLPRRGPWRGRSGGAGGAAGGGADGKRIKVPERAWPGPGDARREFGDARYYADVARPCWKFCAGCCCSWRQPRGGLHSSSAPPPRANWFAARRSSRSRHLPLARRQVREALS